MWSVWFRGFSMSIVQDISSEQFCFNSITISCNTIFCNQCNMPQGSLTASRFLSGSSPAVANAACPSRNELKRFKHIYGITPTLCSFLWKRLFPKLSSSKPVKHSLWVLQFLKSYGTEAISARAEGCTEKTFTKWCWDIIYYWLADFDLVSWRDMEFFSLRFGIFLTFK